MISILMPSLRPELAERTINAWEETTSLPHEIILVSPFHIQHKNVRCIHEEYPQGTIIAMNTAHQNATGDFIVQWSDDAIPRHHCLENIIHCLENSPHDTIAAFRITDHTLTEACQWQVFNKHYAMWSAIRSSYAKQLSPLLSTDYHCFWGDPDLSMRIYQQGGNVTLAKNAWAIAAQHEDGVKSGNLSRWFAQDAQTFMNKWATIHGHSPDTPWQNVNVPVPKGSSMYQE